jgi:hypothetical protein
MSGSIKRGTRIERRCGTLGLIRKCISASGSSPPAGPPAVGALIAQAIDSVSDTTIALTVDVAVPIGVLLILRIGVDNASSTTPTFTCADSRANTWTLVGQGVRPIAAGTGVAGAMFKCSPTTALEVGDTITVTLSDAVAMKAAYVEAFSGWTTTEPVGESYGIGSATSLSVSPAVAMTAAGELTVGMMAMESNADPTYDSDTTNGSWAGNRMVKSDSGTSTTSIEVGGQYKEVTAAGNQTINWTMAVATDTVAIQAAFAAA